MEEKSHYAEKFQILKKIMEEFAVCKKTKFDSAEIADRFHGKNTLLYELFNISPSITKNNLNTRSTWYMDSEETLPVTGIQRY